MLQKFTYEVYYIEPVIDTFVRSHPELGKKDIPESFVLGSLLCIGCYTYIKGLCMVNTETVSSHSRYYWSWKFSLCWEKGYID